MPVNPREVSHHYREDRLTLGEHFLAECFLWAFPAACALFGHNYGGLKARLPGAGPGLHIMWNDETETAVGHWRYFADNLWLFGAYGVVLLATGIILRSLGLRLRTRLLVWAIMALPGLFYFREMAYLGGKILFVG